MAETTYSAVENLNLSDARMKNQTREEYKKRKKQNRQALKLYDKIGREQFQEMFPEGMSYQMFDIPTKEEMKEDIKTLGEAK